MDVWSEKYLYYAYDEIHNKYSRLIFRTLNYLQPKSIMLCGTGAAIRKVVELGAPNAAITNQDAECYIIEGNIPNISFADKTSSKANFAVIRLSPNEEEILFKNINYGMSFGNSRIRIYIMLCKLPRQDFNVWL